MTYPPVIRVFFAIDLPVETKEKIGRFIGTLKKKAKSNVIRWSKPENLHVTLQFLPEVRSEHISELVKNVRKEVEGIIKSAHFSLGSLHLFPNPYRPRVIVLDISPQTELANLSDHIGHGIKASQYEVEARPFRAHLTLGRIKQPQAANLNFLAECTLPEIDKIRVDEVILFRSEPQPEGSAYTPLEHIHLMQTIA